MSIPVVAQGGDIFYPESDGLPMSDNTLQFRWIWVLAANLQALFRDRPDVFACGNQNWYPVKGEPRICAAPDAYVVFGRPKGERGSYKQWEENDIPMTVVFEVLSPGNTTEEMAEKFLFYEEYGVEEYYIYNPDTNHLQGYVRRGEVLKGVLPIAGYVSPRLGIRFDLSGPELVVRYPDGQPFMTVEDWREEKQQEKQRADQERQRANQEWQRAEKEGQRAEQERQRAEKEKQRAEQERQRADQEGQLADQERQRADQERQRADQERQRADRLAELTRKMLSQQATLEEQQELQRLLQKLD